MPALSNYPNIRPSLLLDFANSGLLDPRVEFTRASIATYYDGKSVVKTEENLLYPSASGSTASGGATSNGDGSHTLTAAGQGAYRGGVGNMPAGVVFTVSCELAGSGSVRLSGLSGSGVNLGSEVPIVLSNVPTRYSWTGTNNVAGNNVSISVRGALDNSAATVTLTNMQVELRAYATAYTPTTTQAISNFVSALASAPVGVPRIEFDPLTGECLGLLIEEARTNLFDNSTFVGAVSGTPGVAPNGWSMNASTGSTFVGPSRYLQGNSLRFSATAGRQFIVKNVSLAAGQVVSFSISVDVISAVALQVNNMFTAIGSSAPTVRYFVDGVERPASFQPSVGFHKILLLITATVSGGLEQRIGIGTGGNSTGVINFDLPQLEIGQFPTSFIPTTTSAATRAADVAQMTGSNFANWYRSDCGTMLSEYVQGLSDGTQAVFAIDNGTVNNRVNLYADGTLAAPIVPKLVVSVNGVLTVDIVHANSTGGVLHKLAASWAVNDFSSVFDARAPIVDISSGVPIVDRATFGGDGTGAAKLNGHLKRIAYYPARLANSQIQALTQS